MKTLNSNRPKTGDKKEFFGKIFVYSGHSWGLDEVCTPIDNKHSGTSKLYYPHPVTK